jgi:hypothetical protein
MNSSIIHARNWSDLKPLSNDDRRALWAARYFSQGHHRTPQKPRVRVQNRPQH